MDRWRVPRRRWSRRFEARPPRTRSYRDAGAQPLLDPVGDAQRVGDDGQGRVHRSDRGKEARVGEIDIIAFVRLAVQVQDRRGRVASEACGPRLVRRAADGNVLSEVEAPLQEYRVRTGLSEHLLQFLLQPGVCLLVAFGEFQNHAIAVMKDAAVSYTHLR